MLIKLLLPLCDLGCGLSYVLLLFDGLTTAIGLLWASLQCLVNLGLDLLVLLLLSFLGAVGASRGAFAEHWRSGL